MIFVLVDVVRTDADTRVGANRICQRTVFEIMDSVILLRCSVKADRGHWGVPVIVVIGVFACWTCGVVII